MSSIDVGELKEIFKDIDDDYEVIINIHHIYDISKESGKRGWIACINGVDVDHKLKEVRLMN